MISLVSSCFVESFSSYLYEYDVDGLKVLFLDNDKKEFTFNATVFNKHSDDRGLPHIIEHMVFGGSRNFNFKEPFEYIVQTKKYTYLNAITFKDRTVFPYSTYCEKSFDEILDVYIDGIFNPNLSVETFNQEVIRFDGGEFNGIIYNEMTDMYKDDKYIEEVNILKKLEINTLKYNSAGNPDSIKSVTYKDAIEYYNKTYSKDNIILSFYGKIDINKQLLKIENVLRDSKISKFSEREFIDDVVNLIDIVRDKESEKLVVAIKPTNYDMSLYSKLMLEYLIVENNSIISRYLNSHNNVESFSVHTNYDLNIYIVYVDVKYKDNKGDIIYKDDVVKLFFESIDNLEIELIKKIAFKYYCNQKIKDFGYKSEGIYTLIEISKTKSDIVKYFEKNGLNLLIFTENLQGVITKTNKKHISSSHIFDVFVKKITEIINVGEKLVCELTFFDLYDFFYFKNYDIITIITSFNMVEGKNNILNLDFKSDFFYPFSFVQNINVFKGKSYKKGYDSVNVVFDVISKNYDNDIKIIKSAIKNAKFDELFSFKDKKINRNSSIDEAIEYCLFDKEENNYKNEDCTETDFIEYFVEKNYEFICVDSHSLSSNKYSVIPSKQLNKYIPSELYKNIFIFEYDYNIDLIYLELVLEILLNEIFIPKIRLENGAYDVGYKILKLENKVVLYSNIDKNYIETLEIFKGTLESLKKCKIISLEYFEKYQNKITNNYYRNEQNKNKKKFREFVNQKLKVENTLESFDIEKINCVVDSISKIKGEQTFSFGEQGYSKNSNGGMYVY